MKIILGSQSKGRKQMMEEMGIEFEVMSANIDEKAIRLKDPKELTLALARAKAETLKEKISEPVILITSDQVIVWEGKILEKPQDEREARKFLEGYNSHPAETVTAVVAINLAASKRAEGVDIAKVYFNPFSEGDIDRIIKEGSVFHMAGGFTVDGKLWEPHIKKVEGTRDSVIGLPKELTKKLIREVAE